MDCMLHCSNDNVGVVLHEVQEDAIISVKCLEDGNIFSMKASCYVPENFKISLKDIGKGEDIIEYGEVIGVATSSILEGQSVHIHNIKSLRI